MNKIFTPLAASLLVCAAGCVNPAPHAPTQTGTEGVLFVAGGAVDQRGPVLPRFFAEAEKASRRRQHSKTSIEIIPVASGDPAGSLQYNWDNFACMAPSLQIDGLPLSQEDERAAMDPTIAARFENASALWFTGGNQSRITALFEPELRPEFDPPPWRERRLIELATRRMLQDGGVIAGSSAGAAMMADPMIAGGRSEGALLNGEGEGGVQTKAGMGYFPFGLVDQHFMARGRMGRLLVAMAIHSERYGFGVEENSAMVVSLGSTPFIEVVGPSGLCVLDLGDLEGNAPLDGPRPYGANAVPDSWEFELSLLGTGDRWDPIAGKAIPHAGRMARHGPAASPAPDSPVLNPWDPDALEKALLRLSLDPERPQVMLSEQHRVQLSATPRSSFLINCSHASDLFATGVSIIITRL